MKTTEKRFPEIFRVCSYEKRENETLLENYAINDLNKWANYANDIHILSTEMRESGRVTALLYLTLSFKE